MYDHASVYDVCCVVLPALDHLSVQAVANQPVSVAIEADERGFQLYAGGVFDAPCGTALDHGVLIVRPLLPVGIRSCPAFPCPASTLAVATFTPVAS
jgi:hypothetical protein